MGRRAGRHDHVRRDDVLATDGHLAAPWRMDHHRTGDLLLLWQKTRQSGAVDHQRDPRRVSTMRKEPMHG